MAFILGGAGFIGSHLIRLLVNKYPSYQPMLAWLLGSIANTSLERSCWTLTSRAYVL